MMNTWGLSALWVGLALIATLIKNADLPGSQRLYFFGLTIPALPLFSQVLVVFPPP